MKSFTNVLIFLPGHFLVHGSFSLSNYARKEYFSIQLNAITLRTKSEFTFCSYVTLRGGGGG